MYFMRGAMFLPMPRCSVSALAARACLVEQLEQIGLGVLHLLRRSQISLGLGLNLQGLQRHTFFELDQAIGAELVQVRQRRLQGSICFPCRK
jgi:hypothetical protein